MPLSNERWGLNVGRRDKTSINVNNIKERGTTVETHAQCSVLMSKKKNKIFPDVIEANDRIKHDN